MAKKRISVFEIIAAVLAVLATLCMFFQAVEVESGDGFTGKEIIFGIKQGGIASLEFNAVAFVAYFLPLFITVLMLFAAIIRSKKFQVFTSICYLVSMLFICGLPAYWYLGANEIVRPIYEEIEMLPGDGLVMVINLLTEAFLFSIVGAFVKDDKGEERGYEQATVTLGKLIAYAILTLGVYYYIWIYRTTRFTNVISEEEKRSPVNQTLLCMIVPFYVVYWFYKTAKKVELAYAKRGEAISCATVCAVCAIFIDLISMVIVQEKINSLCAREIAENKQNEQVEGAPVEEKPANDVFEM